MIPSLRYSCSGSPLAFSKGKTASESMILETRGGRIAAVCTEEVRVSRLPVEDERLVVGIGTGFCFFFRDLPARLGVSL